MDYLLWRPNYTDGLAQHSIGPCRYSHSFPWSNLKHIELRTPRMNTKKQRIARACTVVLLIGTSIGISTQKISATEAGPNGVNVGFDFSWDDAANPAGHSASFLETDGITANNCSGGTPSRAQCIFSRDRRHYRKQLLWWNHECHHKNMQLCFWLSRQWGSTSICFTCRPLDHLEKSHLLCRRQTHTIWLQFSCNQIRQFRPSTSHSLWLL